MTIHHQRHVAIIDIGSNSIRLVVYDGLARTPVAIFNEKAVCALGQGLGASGRLNPDGRRQALASLGRFVRLARAMPVDVLEILATAAVRDAVDGADFVREVEEHCQSTVSILSGEQEARLAASGVLCSTPDADGIVADLGGGSLELVSLNRGEFAGPYATMPLGILRLTEASGGERAKAAQIIDSHLARFDWTSCGRDRPLYAVGGAWRALARLFIAQTGHPLHVLDNYTLSRAEALTLLDQAGRQNRKATPDKVPGLSKKRVPHLPMAAVLLEKVLLKVQPSKLIFSVYGMREGQFYNHLSPDVRAQDPLIAACVEMARTAGRFPEHGTEMMDWMAPLFVAQETPRQRRLRHAASLLGDVFWNEHPDYRSEQAFLRVFRLPFMGMGHQDRAALALAVHARYETDSEFPRVQDARTLLSEDEQRRARIIGMALRLGHSISGGVPGILRSTRLRLDGPVLALEVPASDPAFDPDLNSSRYERLAKAVGCDRFEMRRVS